MSLDKSETNIGEDQSSREKFSEFHNSHYPKYDDKVDNVKVKKEEFDSEDHDKQTLKEKFSKLREARNKQSLREKFREEMQIKKFSEEKQIRKRKIRNVKIPPQIKKEKLDNEPEEVLSMNNPKFDWKHFLTAAPLENECDEKCDNSHIQKYEEELDEYELDEDGTIKDVDVPRAMLKLARINKEILKLERKNKHINKNAWNSLFGADKPSEPEDTNYTQCEICNVRLNIKNIYKHHKKCNMKLGMKRQ